MAKHVDMTDDGVRRYVFDHGTREHPAMADLRRATIGMAGSGMQVSPDQAQILRFLVGLIGARRVLEIGTYTGYSALAMALALPPDGTLVACDRNADWTRVGAPFWQEAGVSERIDLRLGPALDTLQGLLNDGPVRAFDMAFIDADKTSYDAYYEACLRLVRPGGVIAIDNVMWSGAVAAPSETSDDTQALRALNAKIQADTRVEMCLLTIGDGMTLVRPL